MRIEEITDSQLKSLGIGELMNLRYRCLQIFEKHFQEDPETKPELPGIDRAELLGRYQAIAKELKSRGRQFNSTRIIDEEIFKRALYGVDVPNLPDIPLIENFISIAGSFIKSPAEANDLDIVIREAEGLRDEGLEAKLAGILKSHISKKDAHFIYSPKGPHAAYIPIFDLTLTPRKETKRLEPEEPKTVKKELSAAEKKDFEEENQRIAENKKKPEATRPHRFKVAKWTHVNGHPRCLLCGDEEPRGGVCNMPSSWYDRQDWDDEAAWAEERKKLRAEGLIKGDIKPLRFFLPIKIEKDFALDDIWDKWAKGYLDKGIKISVQENFNGRRTILELDDKGKTLLFFEDSKKDRSSQFPDLEAEIKTIGEAVILDAEIGAVSSKGEVIPGEDLAYWGKGGKIPLGFKTPAGIEGRYTAHIFDVLYYEGKAANTLPYEERRKVLKRLFGKYDFKILKLTPEEIVGSKGELVEAVKKAEKRPGSEGAVLRALTGDYPLTGETSAWARVKALKGTAKEEKIEKEEEGGGGEFGNIDFKLGDSGVGVAQIHIIGLTEEEAAALRDQSNRAIIASGDIRKLEAVLKSIIGEKGAHIDIRLRKKGAEYWEGGEIMIGNISGLPKLLAAEKGRKLRFAWKQSRAEEERTETVRGPLSWLDAGKRKVAIFNPGEPGATTEKFAAMINLAIFDWELYQSDEHAKKLHIRDGRFFEGNWLIAYVPVEDKKRVWMISSLEEEDFSKAIGRWYSFIKIEKKKQIVGGIVYPANTYDAHDEAATTEDLEGGMFNFMEESRLFKINHKGRSYQFPILECFQAEIETMKAGKKVPAGAWWLTVKITDAEIWKRIESGELIGFSMGGRARREMVSS